MDELMARATPQRRIELLCDQLHGYEDAWDDGSADPHRVVVVECNRFSSAFIGARLVLEQCSKLPGVDLVALGELMQRLVQIKKDVLQFIMTMLHRHAEPMDWPPDDVRKIPPGGLNSVVASCVESFGSPDEPVHPSGTDIRQIRASDLCWRMGKIVRELALCSYIRWVKLPMVTESLCVRVLECWVEMDTLVQSTMN